jgi:hypothetical protein
MDDDLSRCLLVGELAAYLRAHPFACDTAEGIRHWWFETEVAMDELMAALEWMRLHQLVEALGAADGRVRYRRLASVEQLGTPMPDIGTASDDAA